MRSRDQTHTFTVDVPIPCIAPLPPCTLASARNNVMDAAQDLGLGLDRCLYCFAPLRTRTQIKMKQIPHAKAADASLARNFSKKCMSVRVPRRIFLRWQTHFHLASAHAHASDSSRQQGAASERHATVAVAGHRAMLAGAQPRCCRQTQRRRPVSGGDFAILTHLRSRCAPLQRMIDRNEN